MDRQAVYPRAAHRGDSKGPALKKELGLARFSFSVGKPCFFVSVFAGEQILLHKPIDSPARHKEKLPEVTKKYLEAIAF
jgi:hypothetical protein